MKKDLFKCNYCHISWLSNNKRCPICDRKNEACYFSSNTIKDLVLKLENNIRTIGKLEIENEEIRQILPIDIFRPEDIIISTGYQDEDRTYTTGERQLATRLDCKAGRLEAA